MILYHQIRVGSKFLANEGSISSHIQLKEDRSKVYHEEHNSKYDFIEQHTVILWESLGSEVALPSHRDTLLLHVQSSERSPCHWRSAQQLLHVPCNGWRLLSSALWSATLRDPGQRRDPQPEPAAVPLLRPPRRHRHSPLPRGDQVISKLLLIKT